MSSSLMDAPRHVLMSTDAVGGMWTYAVDLSRELTGRGVRVTLAVAGPPPSEAQRQLAMGSGVELEALGGELDWTAASAADVDLSGRKLAELAGRIRPDLVHLNTSAFAAKARFPAPVVVACHSCVKTWWAAVRGCAASFPPDLAWRADMTHRGYEAADLLLAPTQAFAEATRRAYGLARTPRVVWNGRRRRRASGLQPPPVPFVLTAGRLWDEGKDVATLDRAASRIDAEVLAAGPLEGPDGARAALANLQPLGRLEEASLDRRLAQRPVFVSPALYEPFGLAVLEAAQAACPLVLSDIASFRELWDGAAVFFPPGDDAALAQALQALLADSETRSALAEAACARARRYTASAMAQATLDAYREAQSAPAAGRAVA